MKNKILRPFFFFTLLTICLSSCYEPNEACLDRYASNYDVAADDACKDCCIYPDLIVQFSHTRNELTVSPGDTLLDGSVNLFVLNQLEYFISELVLIDVALNEIKVLDTIEISTLDDTRFYTHDFQHITLAQTSYSFGQVISENDIQAIRFKLGVVPSNIVFDDLDDSFVLSKFKDSLYTNGSYIPWQISLQRDTFDLRPAEDFSGVEGSLLSFEFTQDLEVTLGENITARVNVDVDKLLQNCNVRFDSYDELLSKLTNNLANAFN